MLVTNNNWIVMKRIIFIIALSLPVMSMCAGNNIDSEAEYVQMIDTTKVWVYEGCDKVTQPYQQVYMKFTSKCCEANGKTYREFAVVKRINHDKIYVDNHLVKDTIYEVNDPDPESRFLREEPGKVFLLTKDSIPVGDIAEIEDRKMGEFMIYDFTKNDGDLFLHCFDAMHYRYSRYYTVDKRADAVIAGRKCRSYGFREITFMQPFGKDVQLFIEGIGVTYQGVLSYIYLSTIDSSRIHPLSRIPMWAWLKRVYDGDGNVIYENPEYLSEKQIKPATNHEIGREYYTIDGRRVLNPSGKNLYIVRIQYEDGRIESKKCLGKLPSDF